MKLCTLKRNLIFSRRNKKTSTLLFPFDVRGVHLVVHGVIDTTVFLRCHSLLGDYVILPCRLMLDFLRLLPLLSSLSQVQISEHS